MYINIKIKEFYEKIKNNNMTVGEDACDNDIDDDLFLSDKDKKSSLSKSKKEKIEEYNKNPSMGDKFDVQMISPIILNDFLNNGLNGQGKQLYFYYDPFTANCQIWINGLMKFNGLLNNNPDLEKFIMQDYTTLIKNIPSATKSLMSGATSLARRFNILTQGKGFNFHPLHDMV